MPCAGPVQQEGLAQILRQRKASEYRKTRRGQSPWRALCPDPRTAPGPHKDKKAPARRATPIRPPRRTMSQDAERPARDDPPCGTCSPHDAGRGPYAPQRRLGCPRRRYLPITRRGPQGLSPRGPLPAHAARAAPGARTALIEKRPPRARRPALPQPRAAVLSAKAGLTAGFGMGPGDPRLCGRARGGRSPAAHDMEPARSPLRGDPGGRMAGTDRRRRIALGAYHRGCEELGLLVPLG